MTATIERATVTDPVFTTTRAALADAATTVARALPARPSAPILAGARLHLAGDTLTVSGFDYETSTAVTLPAEGKHDGTVIVSGNLLAQIAKSLPDKPVHVTVEGPSMRVTCGASRFTLPTMPVDDYPQLPAMPDPAGSVEAGAFTAAVEAVKACVSNDDTLPMLTGIRVEFTDTSLTLVATDRFRLAVNTIPFNAAGPVPDPILVPGKALVGTARNATTGHITLHVGDGVLGTSNGNTESTMRVLDAEFPKYQQLLPDTYARAADVNVSALTDAVKRAALVAERGVRVELEFTGTELAITSGDQGSASTETMPCDLVGEPITIAFNPGYLLAGLAAVGTDRALVGMTGANRPALLTPNPGGGYPPAQAGGGFERAPGDHLYLLMPVRIDGAQS